MRHALPGGIVTHSALRTFDDHRWHAPVAGTVLEAKVIRGQDSLDVKVEADAGAKRLAAVEGAGYRVVQMLSS